MSPPCGVTHTAADLSAVYAIRDGVDHVALIEPGVRHPDLDVSVSSASPRHQRPERDTGSAGRAVVTDSRLISALSRR